MTSEHFWMLFVETGNILYYLLYKEAIYLENAETQKTA